MSKLKTFFIKIGLIPAPKGFKYNPLDADGDGKVQEGTPFERSVTLDELKKKRPVKKPVKKAAKKAPAKKKAAKKAK
jgi:hypothetical protein